MKKKTNTSGRPIAVQAGVIDDVSSIVKKLFDTIFKGIDKLLDGRGYDKKDSKEVDVDDSPSGENYFGTETIYESGNGDQVKVTVVQTSKNPDKFTVTVKANGHREIVKKNVKSNKIDDVVTSYMDSELSATNEGPIESSKRLQVTLKRVAASTGAEIHLTAINANYSIVEAMTDLDVILADDEFANMITDEPKSFEITEVEDEDEYDVNEMDEDEEVDTTETYSSMFFAALQLQYNLQYIHWGAKGEQFAEIHRMVDSIMWCAREHVDVLAELMVEKTGVVPHPGTAQFAQLPDPDGLNFQSSLEYAITSIHDFIDVLEGYYVNLDHDVQGQLDSWIRDMKKNADYFMKRQTL